MNKRIGGILRRGQRGFTLIELVAVMAILAILVAVVAPAVTDTRDASVRAQAGADAKEVTNRATKFFGDAEGSEVRTPHSVLVTELTALTDTQEISSRWPEQFITRSSVGASAYSVEFDAGIGGDKVVQVNLKDENNDSLTSTLVASFLADHTAIDFIKIGGIGEAPSTARQTTTVTFAGGGTVEVHDFLWLFRKTTSGSGLANDTRVVSVYILTGTEINEGTSTVNLTYKRVQ